MRVIPPKYYEGKIPSGYGKKDFFRFDQDSEDTYGVLYSGERINVNHSSASVGELKEYKQNLAVRIWSGIKSVLKWSK